MERTREVCPRIVLERIADHLLTCRHNILDKLLALVSTRTCAVIFYHWGE